MTDQIREQIYTDYSGKVYGYILSKTCDAHLAEDLCADVFLKVYEKLDTFDESKASLSTWIFTITRNRLTDHYRTRRVMDEVPETIAVDSSLEDDVCTGEMLDTLASALEQIDERGRDIIVMHYYSGMTLKAIAERIGISYAYVKILHNKALSALKNYF